MDFANAEFLHFAATHRCSQISIWDRDRIGALCTQDEETLAQIVAELGARSGRAQGLNGSITTLQRVRQRGQLLLIHFIQDGSSTRVTGFLKTGVLNLFLADARGSYEAVNACCVLDFYVCESCQRQGVGSRLFAAALHHLSTVPEYLAYDRPSSKLVAFLAKNYGLVHGVTQPNNFMIFRGFFQGNKRANRKENAHTSVQSVSIMAQPTVQFKLPTTDPMGYSRVQTSVVGNSRSDVAHAAAHSHQQVCISVLEPHQYMLAEQRPTMNEVPASVKSDRVPLLQPVGDQWMLPQANRTINSENFRENLQTRRGKESFGVGSLTSIQDHKPECAAGDAPARTVADPELKAALEVDTGSQWDRLSTALSQGNQLCGLRFEDSKIHKTSGLQYTLGGNDSSYRHTQSTWCDKNGSERSVHQRYRRLKR